MQKINTSIKMLFFSFLSLTSFAQEPIAIHKALSEIVVDGHANEASWQEIQPYTFDNFYNVDKSTDRQQTEWKMLWDDEFIYIHFNCKDRYITAREKQRDGAPYFDDCAEIFLTPTADKIDLHWGFEINLYKTANDFIFLHNFYKNDNVAIKAYNPNYQVATSIDGTLNDNSDMDNGWTMEIAIPHAAFYNRSLLQPIEAGSQWTFLALRQDRNDTDGERRTTSTLFPLKRNGNVHNPKCFGLLEFVGK